MKLSAAIVAVCVIVAHVYTRCPVVAQQSSVSSLSYLQTAQLMLMAVSQAVCILPTYLKHIGRDTAHSQLSLLQINKADA